MSLKTNKQKLEKHHVNGSQTRKSILAKMYIFLVLFTNFAFYREKKIISKNCKIYFSTRNIYILVKILS